MHAAAQMLQSRHKAAAGLQDGALRLCRGRRHRCGRRRRRGRQEDRQQRPCSTGGVTAAVPCGCRRWLQAYTHRAARNDA